MTVAAAEPHTAAVAGWLETGSLLVGRGERPDEGGWQGEPGDSTFREYVVLYPSPGLTDGVLGDPHEELEYMVQATCVAATQEGAERVADAVKILLVGRIVPVTGRGMYPFQLVSSSPATRDDQVAPPQHYSVLQLAARSGPA